MATKKPQARKDRPFPRVSLETALRIGQVIREKNAGNPWPPSEVAKALGVGSKTGNYYYLTAAARDYGITAGSSATESIQLTELGKSYFYAPSAEKKQAALRSAFLNVPVFKRCVEYYKGNNLPEKEFLQNTLESTFGLSEGLHDDFIELFQKNCRFTGIGTSFGTTSGDLAASSDSATLVVPGSPADGRLCFIIMPFVERDERHPPGFFQEVLNSLLIPAAKAAGFVARTASRHGSDVIQSTIINDLLRADLVLADLTEHNPNVLFELGMRMHEDKPTALIKAKGTGRIFDVDNMLRVLEYDPCLWPTTVERDLPELTAHIKAAWDNRGSATTYMKLLRQGPLTTSIDMEREYR
jgi:hypothetical protein